jgi:hypothetical protein
MNSPSIKTLLLTMRNSKQLLMILVVSILVGCNFSQLKSQTLLSHLTTDEFLSLGFGADIDIDGNFAVVGSVVGHVHIYEKIGNEWVLDEVLYSDDYGSGEVGFGYSVSISNLYIAVGDFYRDAVYLYHRENGEWILIDSLSNSNVEHIGPFLSLEYPYIIIGGVSQAGEDKIYIYRIEGDQLVLKDDPTASVGAGYVINSTLDISNLYAVVGGTDSVQVYINGSDWTLHQTIHKDYESTADQGFGWSIDLFFDPSIGQHYLIIGDPHASLSNGRIQIYKTVDTYFEKFSDFPCSDLGGVGAAACGGAVSIDSDFAISSGTLYGDNGFLVFEKEISAWSYLQDYTETQYDPNSFGFKVKLDGNNLFVSDFSPSGLPSSVFAYDMEGITNTSHLNNDTPSVLIYPNPTSGKILIDTDNTIEISEIKVTNVYGQLVGSFDDQISRNQFQIEIEGQPGFYFLELITNRGKYIVKKILKK